MIEMAAFLIAILIIGVCVYIMDNEFKNKKPER